MLLKNNRKTNGNIINQFYDFKKQIERSGQNPQAILNELIKNGKVKKSDLDRVKNIAQTFSYLIK